MRVRARQVGQGRRDGDVWAKVAGGPDLLLVPATLPAPLSGITLGRWLQQHNLPVLQVGHVPTHGVSLTPLQRQHA
jgi:hypothetical protein